MPFTSPPARLLSPCCDDLSLDVFDFCSFAFDSDFDLATAGCAVAALFAEAVLFAAATLLDALFVPFAFVFVCFFLALSLFCTMLLMILRACATCAASPSSSEMVTSLLLLSSSSTSSMCTLRRPRAASRSSFRFFSCSYQRQRKRYHVITLVATNITTLNIFHRYSHKYSKRNHANQKRNV